MMELSQRDKYYSSQGGNDSVWGQAHRPGPGSEVLAANESVRSINAFYSQKATCKS